MTNAAILTPAESQPRRVRITRRTAAAPGVVLKVLSFLLGLTMPFISFDQREGFTRSLANRVEPVDLVCLLLVAALLFSGRLRLTWAFFVYSLALVVSLIIASATNPTGGSFTAFAALMMAVLYYAAGRSIAEQQVLVKALLAGLLISTLIESAIVLHDYFLPKWFPTRHSDRVRGTFRSTAQLGGYGFTVAGIMLAFAWPYFRSTWVRMLVMTAGVMGIFFVLSSTRRAGMFALLVWLGLFLLIGLKHLSRRSYWVVLSISLLGILAATLWSTRVSKTHMVDRFFDAYDSIAQGESFTHEQFYKAMDNFEEWFPQGIGVGQSSLIMVRYETHNGHLGVLVEQGVLGLIGYYGLWLPLIRRKWKHDFGRHTEMVKLVTMTFLCGAFVFMIHARQDRDRIFMLFLGLAPLVAVSTDEVVKRVARRRNAPTAPPLQPATLPQPEQK